MAGKKRWYAMKASTQGDKTVAEIRIYDEIGFWGVTAKDFMQELDAVAGSASEVVVSINSPGGSVFDAFAIYNGLRRVNGKVITRVDGVAASAASMIFMAGEERIMPENAMLMIHNAWTIAGGTAEDLRDTAEMMDKLRDGIVAAYRRSGTDEAEIVEMMDATTWMSALDAQSMGFCTLMEEPVQIAASAKMAEILGSHANAPTDLMAALEGDKIEETQESDEGQSDDGTDTDETEDSVAPEDGEPEGAPDPAPAPSAAELTKHIFASCREQGISNMAEGILLSGGLDGRERADNRIAEAKEIAGICVAAKLPEKAAEFVAAGLNVEQVRARLFDAVVDAAGAISNIQRPENEAPRQGGPSVGDIYAARAAARQATYRN